jgi:glutamate--cysteine ligase
MLNQLTNFFAKKFASGRGGVRHIGLEYEFPVVRKNGEAISYDVAAGLFSYLYDNGWRLVCDPTTNAVVGAQGDIDGGAAQPSAFIDRIELELGYCTLEMALAPEPTLFAAERRLERMMARIVPYLREQDCRVLGYGIQPQTLPRRELVSPRGKCQVYERTSPNFMMPTADGKDIHLFTITAANQCHIDVDREEAIAAVNVLNGLVGLQMALCVNSPVWKGRVDPHWKAAREMFYDGMTNWNGRVGNPVRFKDFSDYVIRLCACPTILVKRENEYLALPHYATAFDYFDASDGARAEKADGTPVFIKPVTSDLEVFAGLWWHTARLSPAYGTLEARGFCQQPPGETMGASALVLGIVEQLDAAEQILETASWDAWVRLREDVARQGLEARFLGEPIRPLVERLLAVAEAGLQKRGLGEEVYLEPLRKRLALNRTPADHAIEVFSKSGMDGLVDMLSLA